MKSEKDMIKKLLENEGMENDDQADEELLNPVGLVPPPHFFCQNLVIDREDYLHGNGDVEEKFCFTPGCFCQERFCHVAICLCKDILRYPMKKECRRVH